MRQDQAKIEELLEEAKYGRISGQDVDRELVRLGMEPLAGGPDPASVDLAKHPWWTLPMSVVWIMFRSENKVAWQMDDIREATSYWWHQHWRHGPDGEVYSGWVLNQFRRANLHFLGLGEDIREEVDQDVPQIMGFKDAKEALWIALRGSCFEATGIEQGSGEREAISAIQWQDLECYSVGWQDELRSSSLGYGKRYRDVLVPQASVRGLWQVPRDKPTELPDIVSPSGDGFMRLFAAAHWIASEGGAFDFIAEDHEVWVAAYDKLLGAVASKKVEVFGVKIHEREPVPHYHFADCNVDYPYESATRALMMDDELYLQSYPYIDEQHWRRGFDDALVNRYGHKWRRLMVPKSQVRELWPFGAFEETVSSGLPGRPTSIHLVEQELLRRAEIDDLLPSLNAESKYLSDWLKHTHPSQPPASPKTIANRLRDKYRSLKTRK